MTGPKASIIITNYNYERFVGRCIESALAQDYPNLEVIVVDDASQDGSRNIILGYKDRVSPILAEQNGGQGAAFNAGFRACSGDVVLFLDADDWLYPHAVSQVVERMTSGVAQVQYRLHLVDAKGNKIDVLPPSYVKFDDGNVVPLLLSKGRYECTVTSGNAFSRATLLAILPIPEEKFRLSADGYVVTVAPLNGNVVSIDEPLGAYAVHGTNNWTHGFDRGPNAAGFRRALGHDADRYEGLRITAARHGLAVASEPGLADTQHLTNRIGSLVLDPAHHPEREDWRIGLALRGAWSSRSANLPVRFKIFLAMWFLALGILPRGWAAKFISWRFNSSSRPEVLHRVMAAIRQRPAETNRAAEGVGKVEIEDRGPSPGEKLARNTFFLLAGQIASMALSVVLSAAIARGLGVTEFGNYFLLMTIATFAYVAVEWGQSAYLVREAARREGERNQLLGASLVFRAVVGIVAALAAALVAAVFWHGSRVESLTLLAVGCGLPFVLAQGYVYMFRSVDRMDLDSIVGVAAKAVTVIATVMALLLGGQLTAVFLMQAVGGIAALLVAVLLARSIRLAAAVPSTDLLREFAVGGAPIAVFFLALALQPFIDAVLLAKLSPPEVVGWYGAARNIMTLLFVPAHVLGNASFPEMSRVAASVPDLNRTVRIAFRLLLGLGALAAAGTYLFADVAIRVVFGEGPFDPAIVLLKVFAPLLPILFMDILFGTTLTAVGKTKELALVKGLSIVVGAALAFLLIPVFQTRYGNGAIGLLISFGLSEVFMLTAFFLLLPKGLVDSGRLLDLLRAVAAAGVTVAVFQVLPAITPWLAVPASVVVFAILAFVFGLASREDVQNLASLRQGFR